MAQLDNSKYWDATKVTELLTEDELKNKIENTNNSIKKYNDLISKYYKKDWVYFIQKWDNPENIAKNFKITTSDFYKTNPWLTKNSKFSIWQKINLPKTAIDTKKLTKEEQKIINNAITEVKKLSSILEMSKKELFEKTKSDLNKLNKEITADKFDFKKESYNAITKQNEIVNWFINTPNSVLENIKNSNYDSDYDFYKKERQEKYTKEIENIFKDPRWKPFEKYLSIINKYRTNTNIFREEIHLKTILLLLINEWSGWNITKKNPTSTAIWLWQILDWTWKDLCSVSTNLPEYKWKISININNRLNAEEQIKAMLLLLDQCARKHNCTYQDAVVYYHLWLNAETIKDSQVWKLIEQNPAISKVAKKDWVKITTAKLYMKYANIYYSQLNV